jgi:GTP-binding protein HflX
VECVRKARSRKAKACGADEGLLKITSLQADRALVVGVEFVSRPQALPRSAALAREAAKLARSEGDASGHHAPSIDNAASFIEFRELVAGAGAEIVAEVLQRRPRPDPATLVGKGKVEEIAAVAESAQATLILFDHDLTPTQLRNLEHALPVRVVDRTQLILDIFARHARSREGQLQVELAQLEYMLPRLTGRGAAMSQLGGGIGTRGPGETQLETDRRKIQRRLLQLKRELEDVRRVRGQQRHRRAAVPVPTIALVGYTNAGKSTLFNRLTDAGVLASSRMFSTLDPKLRALVLPSKRKVLLSDTVGFISNLPHTLITSFRATLEEVEKAEVLLHVQDCSSPQREQQKADVEKVLAELGSLDKPILPVLNKMDLLPPAEQSAWAADKSVAAVSAQTGEGIANLLELMDRALTADPIVEARFMVPQREGAVLAALDAGALILKREFSGDFVDLAVAGPASLLGRYRQYGQANVRVKVRTGRGGGSGATSHETGPV